VIFLYVYKVVTYFIYLIVFLPGKLKARGGDALWRGRLGDIEPSAEKTIWMHAASVGEVRVVGHLINYIKKNHEDLLIHLTVMTRAGFETAAKLYGDKIGVTIFPLDATPAISKTIRKINPSIVIITETEIWFNLLQQLFRLNIPIILINGRMSEKSFRRYRLIRSANGASNFLSPATSALSSVAPKNRYRSISESDLKNSLS